MKDDYGKCIFWFFLSVYGLFVLFGLGAGVLAVLGSVDLLRGALGVLLSTVGAALGIRQIRPIYINYLQELLKLKRGRDSIEGKIKESFVKRLSAIHEFGEIRDSITLSIKSRKLMTPFLQLLESILKTTSPDTRFEISVFANDVEPEIICYYDSDGSTSPSSSANRRLNPQFYRDNNYAAVEVLENPQSASSVIVFNNTEKFASYSFRDSTQNARIKSTCLCSIDDSEPIVIVLVANRPDFFSDDDNRLSDLIKSALVSIACEINLCNTIKFPNAGSTPMLEMARG